MTPERLDQQSGMTFTELAWLLVILLIGALIFGSMLRPRTAVSRPRSANMRCLAHARAIAMALRSYASNWDGWTNPDPCYYVKEFGFKLNTETGYCDEVPPWYVPGAVNPTQSQLRAESFTDFRCPLDGCPILRAHGIPTSFQVCASLAGYSVMAMKTDPNRVLAVAEVGERHPLRGRPRVSEKHPLRDKPLAGYYVFADLSVTLGYRPPRGDQVKKATSNAR